MPVLFRSHSIVNINQNSLRAVRQALPGQVMCSIGRKPGQEV